VTNANFKSILQCTTLFLHYNSCSSDILQQVLYENPFRKSIFLAFQYSQHHTQAFITSFFFAVSDQTSDQLEIYQLPIDTWHKELQQFLAKVSAAKANGSQVSVDSDQEVSRVLAE